jgi:hypothetical protein
MNARDGVIPELDDKMEDTLDGANRGVSMFGEEDDNEGGASQRPSRNAGRD